MGGSIALLVSQGHRVHLVDMTNGEPTPLGSFEKRAKEAADAARILGVGRTLVGLPNRQVIHSIEARHQLAAIYRVHRPDWIFLPFPIDAHPDHASLYLLELYPNAPHKEEMARAGWSLAPDDEAAEMYLQAMERLERAGLVQYEISNVARPGRASRHNLKYWTDGEWLGFGCGAHSTYGGSRWKNVAATADYIARVAGDVDLVVERRVLTRDERLEEALFTGLRLSAGIEMDAMQRVYDVDVWGRYGEALQPFVEAGRLLREGSRLRLTRDGMLTANDVMAVFV